MLWMSTPEANHPHGYSMGSSVGPGCHIRSLTASKYDGVRIGLRTPRQTHTQAHNVVVRITMQLGPQSVPRDGEIQGKGRARGIWAIACLFENSNKEWTAMTAVFRYSTTWLLPGAACYTNQ